MFRARDRPFGEAFVLDPMLDPFLVVKVVLVIVRVVVVGVKVV